jgi:uncharacterized cofD-like protein
LPDQSTSTPFLKRSRPDPLRIVSIGGGTGLSTLLQGLKKFVLHQAVERPPGWPFIEISAIVTVSDDGGSSGRLRRELDMLPPGDIRNCMVALAEDESLLTRLFQYRFAAGAGLKGHSFGNLFLAVMSQVTGDFARAVQLSSEVLAIAGRIYPATGENVRLRGYLVGGKVVEGETRISRSVVPIERIELLPAGCKPLPEALEAIRKADLITLGPGSLYTSIVPNLLVKGVARAIEQSPALKACIINLMWQPGETTGLTAADHVAAIERHAARRLVEVAVLNNAPVPERRLRRYERQAAHPVETDLSRLMAMGVQVIARPLLAAGAKVRHDPDLTAAVAIDLARRGRRRTQRALALSR